MSFNPHQWYLMGSNQYGGPANVFIGGISSVINTPALLADKLLNYPSGTAFDVANIYNFTIVGSDIECYIGVDYRIKLDAFRNDTSITYYIDFSYCKEIVDSSFNNATGLIDVYFENVMKIGIAAFNNTRSKKYIFPNCVNLTQGVNDSFQFTDCSNAEIIYLPKCVNYGAWFDNTKPFIFTGTTKSGFKLYAEPSMATINAGAEEGDILWARNNKAAIITYVLNFTAPSAITNLTIGTITATTLQLNFTPPSSLNTIDFYEVWLNGRRTDKTVTASGQSITGLTTATLYNVQLKAVDIYYNKSALSNTATATTL